MGYILIINKVNGQNIQNPTVISPTKHIYISQKRTVLFFAVWKYINTRNPTFTSLMKCV